MMIKQTMIGLSTVILLAGCAQNNNTSKASAGNMTNVSYYQNGSGQKPSGQVIARHLVDIADRIPEVKYSTAVVAGKYAVVAINLDKNLDRSRVGTIKYTVAQALKKDPYGTNAIVTSDPDTMERLKRMNTAIKNGKPISGVAEQLAAIVERLMPELSQNTQTPNNQNMMKENNNQIDNQNTKNKIKNIQNQQSTP